VRIGIYDNNNQGYIELDLFTPPGNLSFVPSGTYSIVPIAIIGDIRQNVVRASSGNNSSNDPNPSYVAKKVSGGYYIYYLTEGTLTVHNAGMFSISATSYFGSSITVSYTGNLSVTRYY
jgi:hypothetical protein